MPMPKLLRPRRGDWRSQQNPSEVSRELSAARNLEIDGPIGFDITGNTQRFVVNHPPRIGMFRITGDWIACDSCNPSSSGDSGSSSGVGGRNWPSGWCRALATRVLYYNGVDQWKKDTSAGAETYYIFAPGGYTPDERDDMIAEKIFLPRASVGDDVWCIFNQDSGWWEIIHRCEEFLRFELKDDLAPTDDTVPVGGHATVYLRQGTPNQAAEDTWYSCDAIEFEVYDSMGMFEGTGRTSGGLNGRGVGNRGVCKWFADSRRMEIFQMECP